MNRNTEIVYKGHSKAVFNAIRILKRDMNTVLAPTKEQGGTLLLVETRMEEEQFKIQKNTIYAGDELGFVYALLHISEDALQIPPFWFWYDYKMTQRKEAEIKDYTSKPARVHFRGWFLNDEILLSHWSPDQDPMTPWHMAFEALLRCNGNMVIPTTQVSRDYYRLAAEYGLWLTHHHAEPLGADMFAKVYPKEDPSYFLQEAKYKKLWEDGIEFQKNYKVVWDIGFRGQGDLPFWKCGDGLKYDTDEKRGNLISEIIKYQYDLLHEKVENPICCTYIYGETADLYKKGFIHFPKDVIKIWSDNCMQRFIIWAIMAVNCLFKVVMISLTKTILRHFIKLDWLQMTLRKPIRFCASLSMEIGKGIMQMIVLLILNLQPIFYVS